MATLLIGPVFQDNVQRKLVIENAGAPTNGTSGTAAIVAVRGSLLVDTTTGNFYSNTSATANSPTWTLVGGGSLATGKAIQYTTNAATTNYQLLGTDIAGAEAKVILSMSALGAAGATLTMPTVASVVAAIQAAGLSATPGMTWELEIQNAQNTNTDSWTLTTATGWTLAGTSEAIAKMTAARFLITLTSATAATSQALGQVALTVVP